MPWFPYPSVGVAELNPPDYSTNTSYWNFTNILPQLTAFMDATYGRGHQVRADHHVRPLSCMAGCAELLDAAHVDVRHGRLELPLGCVVLMHVCGHAD